VSAVIMGFVLYFAARGLDPWLLEAQGLLVRFSALAVLIGAGIVSYFAAAHLTGAATLGQLRAVLKRT